MESFSEGRLVSQTVWTNRNDAAIASLRTIPERRPSDPPTTLPLQQQQPVAIASNPASRQSTTFFTSAPLCIDCRYTDCRLARGILCNCSSQVFENNIANICFTTLTTRIVANLPHFRLSTVGSRAFPVAAANIWNALPDSLVSVTLLQTFRRNLKTFLFQRSFR